MLNKNCCSYCDNETVDGVEFPSFPKSLQPQAGEDERLVVADMSSNFLSRQVDINRFALVFCGAQKNIGMYFGELYFLFGFILSPKTDVGFFQSQVTCQISICALR